MSLVTKPSPEATESVTCDLDGRETLISELIDCSDHRARVLLDSAVVARTQESRNLLERELSSGKRVYGVNTGVGPNVVEAVSPAEIERLQTNIVRMLSCSTGKPFPARVVRAAMFARLVSLSKGHSGVRPLLLQGLADLLNCGIHPVVCDQGSVGASGDLVPLAHIASVLIGEGEAEFQGKRMPAREALSQAGLKPVRLSFKEGLSLVNGTSLMTGIGALTVDDAEKLTLVAEAISAFGVEVLLGNTEPFDALVQSVRPHTGQATTASHIRAFLKGSQFTDTTESIQDSYSLRCIPQVLGAVRDMLSFVRGIVTTELNSVSDNPLLFVEDEQILHGGNFQGHHVSMAMDLLSLALNQIGILSERHLARYVDSKYNAGLPPFLVKGKPGLSSGIMGAQLLATSIVAENRLLAGPASVQSIPTNANNQDIVSMGAIAAKKNLPLVENVKTLLSIELFALCRAAESRGLQKLSPSSRSLYDEVRRVSPDALDDRSFSSDFRAISSMILDRKFIAKLEKITGVKRTRERA